MVEAKVKYGNEYLYNLYCKFTSFFSDSDVDLEINPENNFIMIQNNKGEWRKAGTLKNHDEIETLGYMLAGIDEKTLDLEHPVLDCKCPFDGARIHIKIPPTCSRATLSIRRHNQFLGDIFSLQKTGMFTESQMHCMLDAVKQKRNIIISGETGSGKTTLLTALVNSIDPTERIVIVEDTREIFTNHENRAETTTSQFLSGNDAVAATLRENPNRIIYGEVRDEAALSLIEAWNTAHQGGIGTIHANSCSAVRTRLLSLCSKSKHAGNLSNLETAVDEALDVIIQIAFMGNKRYISEIKECKRL